MTGIPDRSRAVPILLWMSLAWCLLLVAASIWLPAYTLNTNTVGVQPRLRLDSVRCRRTHSRSDRDRGDVPTVPRHASGAERTSHRRTNTQPCRCCRGVREPRVLAPGRVALHRVRCAARHGELGCADGVRSTAAIRRYPRGLDE
jgi:hypothetical protein